MKRLISIVMATFALVAAAWGGNSAKFDSVVASSLIADTAIVTNNASATTDVVNYQAMTNWVLFRGFMTNIPSYYVTNGQSGVAFAGLTATGGITVIVTNTQSTMFGEGGGGIVLDGGADTDKNILFRDAGKSTFSWNIYRNEGGKYIYLSDYEAGKDLLTASRSGRFGINKMNNLLNYHTLTSQSDQSSDLELDTTVTEYTPNYQLVYLITVDGTNSTADTYKIETSRDSGVTFTTQSTNNVMTATKYNIGNGIWVKWVGLLTNHTIGETRRFLGIPQLPRASLSVSPMFIDEVMINTNLYGTPAWIDRTYEANSTKYGESRPVRTGTNSAMYIGMSIPNNSFHVNVTTSGIGVALLFEYWNGGAWMAVSNYVDTTANLRVNGDFTWDIAQMSDWSNTNLIVDTYTNLYYWVRARSTNAVSTAAWVQDITRHGNTRFQVYNAPLDDTPSMRVDSDGYTWVGGLPLTPAIVQTFYYKFLAQCSQAATATAASVVVRFTNEVADAYNVYTNAIWYPGSTSMVRINWSVRSGSATPAGRGFYVVLFENGTAVRDVGLVVSGDNADIPLANGTYIFKPSDATNGYQIGVRRFSASDVVLAGGNTNWWFGEKIQ